GAARRPALSACGGGRAPDAGVGGADATARDAGTPPAGAGPPGGAGHGIAYHQRVCRPRGRTCLRPGPGVGCAARGHAAALPSAAGVADVLSEPRGWTDGVPTRGAVAPPGPGSARPGSAHGRPLCAGERLVLSWRAGRGPDPPHAGPGAL